MFEEYWNVDIFPRNLRITFLVYLLIEREKINSLIQSFSVVIVEGTNDETTQFVDANNLSSRSDLVSDAIRETFTDILTGKIHFLFNTQP